jgi:hypothetical protein
LINITAPGLAKGPIIAVGCDHFIQKDDPELVAKELWAVIEVLAKG